MKSELQAAVVQSLFTVVIETQDLEGAVDNWQGMMAGNDITTKRQESRSDFYNEHGMLEMGAGTVGFVAPGDKVNPVGVTRPAGNFGPFVKAQLQAIGASLGLPYEMIAMEFDSSFSASKAAINMATTGFKMQRDWLIYDFCQPVYEEFMANIVAMGYIKAPGFFTDPLKRRAYCQAKWNGPGDLSIDLRQEMQGAAMARTMGTMTNSEIAAKFGSDYKQNAKILHEEQLIWDKAPWDLTPGAVRPWPPTTIFDEKEGEEDAEKSQDDNQSDQA
jgi:capsid protein